MYKLFITLIVSLTLGLGLIGCGLTDVIEDDDSVTITINTIPDIAGVSNQAVEGNIDGNVEITNVTYTVKDSAGNADTTITVSKNNMPTGKKKLDLKTDLAVVLQVTAVTCIGTYILEISATAGSVTSTKADTFAVSGVKNCSAPVGTPIATDTIQAGSNSNATLGSSIDLDAGAAYLSSQAATKVADIDLCYSTTGDGADKLGSPYWAKESLYNYAKNWTNPPQTKFYKSTLTKAQFEAITTKEAIPAFDATKATASSYVVAADEVYQVQTTTGANVLVLINAKTAGAAGSITIKTAR